MSQRKSMIAEDSSTPNSPLRRSSRISSITSAANEPAAIGRRRNSEDLPTTSTTPAKLTRTKRLSLSQDINEEKRPDTPTKRITRTRSGSKSPTSLTEAKGTPALRPRRGSITKIPEEDAESTHEGLTTRRKSLRGRSASPTNEKKESSKPKTRKSVAALESINELETIQPKVTRGRTTLTSRRASTDSIDSLDDFDLSMEVKKKDKASNLPPVDEAKEEESAVEVSPTKEKFEEKIFTDNKSQEQNNKIEIDKVLMVKITKMDTEKLFNEKKAEKLESVSDANNLKLQKETDFSVSQSPKQPKSIQSNETTTSKSLTKLEIQVSQENQLIKNEYSTLKEKTSVDSPKRNGNEINVSKEGISPLTQLNKSKQTEEKDVLESPSKKRNEENTDISKTAVDLGKMPISNKSPNKSISTAASPRKSLTSNAECDILPKEDMKGNDEIKTRRSAGHSLTDNLKDIEKRSKSNEIKASPNKTDIKNSSVNVLDKEEKKTNEAKTSQLTVEQEDLGKSVENIENLDEKNVENNKSNLESSDNEVKQNESDKTSEINEELKVVPNKEGNTKLSSTECEREEVKVNSDGESANSLPITESTNKETETEENIKSPTKIGDVKLSSNIKRLSKSLQSETPKENVSPKTKRFSTSVDSEMQNDNASPTTPKTKTRLSVSLDSELTKSKSAFASPKALTPKIKNDNTFLENQCEMISGSDGSFQLNLSMPVSNNSKDGKGDEKLNTSDGSNSSDKENISTASPNKSGSEDALTSVSFVTTETNVPQISAISSKITSTPKNVTKEQTSKKENIESSGSKKSVPNINKSKSLSFQKESDEEENFSSPLKKVKPAQDENIEAKLLDSFVDELNEKKESKNKSSNINIVDSESDDEVFLNLCSDSEDEKNKNECIDDQAMEGEEDTPSEGSNDIIEEGESLYSTDSDDVAESDDYEEDSFIVDDDSIELLSGDEYDLGDEKKKDKKPKKKSRIITCKDSSDDEVIEVITTKEIPKIKVIQDVVITPQGDPKTQIDLTKSSQEIVPENSTSLDVSLKKRNSAKRASFSLQEDLPADSLSEIVITKKVTDILGFVKSSVKEKGGKITLNVSVDCEKNSSDSGEELNVSKNETQAIQSSIGLGNNAQKEEKELDVSLSDENGSSKKSKLVKRRMSCSFTSVEDIEKKKNRKRSLNSTTDGSGLLEDFEFDEESEKKKKNIKRLGQDEIKESFDRIFKELNAVKEVEIKKKKEFSKSLEVGLIPEIMVTNERSEIMKSEKEEKNKQFKTKKTDLKRTISVEESKIGVPTKKLKTDIKPSTSTYLPNYILEAISPCSKASTSEVSRGKLRYKAKVPIKILPSTSSVPECNWEVTDISKVKPSTKNDKVKVIKKSDTINEPNESLEEKDFKNKMMFNPKRIKRTNKFNMKNSYK